MTIVRPAVTLVATLALAACFGDDRNRQNPDASDNPDDPDARRGDDARPPDAGECTPRDELCNGLDDDCDDDVDEDWPVGDSCTVAGACPPTGQYVCTANGAGVVCNADGDGEPEVCGDGVDNDCSGGDATCPANDAPAGAIDVSAGGTFVMNLSDGTDDIDASCGGANGGGRDVFYELTLPTSEVVYLDTLSSNFDSILAVYDGACTALGTERVCEDDDCGVAREQGAWSLSAGIYCIVVDQYDSAETAGTSRLVVTRGGRTGTALPNLAGSVTGSTTGGTDRATPSCAESTSPDWAAFFTVCPGDAPTITANTCDAATTFDTILHAKRGNGTGGASVACDDDDNTCAAATTRSRISFTASAQGGLYWLIVDGYQTNTGSFRLTYDLN